MIDIPLSVEVPNSEYNSRVSFPIYDHFVFLPTAYSTIQNIREEYMDILGEFEPGLLDELETILDKIVQKSHGKAISNSDGLQIELTKYDTIDDISKSIFEQFWIYDDLDNDLSELQESIDRLEQARTSILQASYS